jgi:S-adenosylmethionine:diacylglycerol 3-amino-3-carboxypropyl transferase
MVLGDITHIGSSAKPVGKFDLVVLCNVFDWLGSDGTKKLLQHLRLHSNDAARLIMYSREADTEMLFQLAPTCCWAVDRESSLALTCMDNTGYHCAVVLFRAA